ncbi:aldo/keto reductase [Natronosporangium hydrolyticum]|uniref:Aldo/keto reductase n=1 Tax=Natronosporangium hydrolyticum TaxID=2811111 RepID=A0A895Y7P7_9ACTN|nr:aldo/keto reductase [Natronosporangium hydrolyticum]
MGASGLPDLSCPPRLAQGVHPVTALQSERSLWERGLEPEVVPVARKLGVGIVPFAPLGRGFLTGAIPAGTSFDPDDLRANDPRRRARTCFVTRSWCRCCAGWRSTDRLPRPRSPWPGCWPRATTWCDSGC